MSIGTGDGLGADEILVVVGKCVPCNDDASSGVFPDGGKAFDAVKRDFMNKIER